MDKDIFTSLIVIIAIILIIGIFMGFDSVPAGHVGVKDKFGVVADKPWGPGISWTGVFTKTVDFSTKIQLREYEAGAASKDLQTVKTNLALNFRVNPIDTPEIYKTIGINYQDVIISPIIQEAVKSKTALYTAEELVGKRGEVKQEITTYITDKLSDKGLIVTEVSITDFKFSEEFERAIEAKQVAEQDAKTAKNKYDEMEWTSKAMKLQSEVLEIKKLDLQEKWIEKWDGSLPKYVTGDSAGMLFNMQIEE